MATASNIKHLEWAVKSRSRNQDCSATLLRLFQEHERKWKSKKFSRAAQDLLAVAFSLWRAAFLADKSSKREFVFKHASDFLLRVVEDNAIGYAQDKNCREWSFNYYTRNARYFLQTLAEHWEGVVPPYQGKTRRPIERWDYCQDLLNEAVANFEELLIKDLTARDQSAKSRIVKTEAKKRRRKSRAITLAGRKAAGATS